MQVSTTCLGAALYLFGNPGIPCVMLAVLRTLHMSRARLCCPSVKLRASQNRVVVLTVHRTSHVHAVLQQFDTYYTAQQMHTHELYDSIYRLMALAAAF